MSSLRGNVVTVTGPLSPQSLGVTLTHEHLFSNWEEKFDEPDRTESHYPFAREPLALENLWSVRTNPLQHIDNLRLDSVEDAVYEVDRFQQAGGNSLVEVTPKNTGMDPENVQNVSSKTGVNIVKGTAYYYYNSHPSRVANATVDSLATEFESDILDGIGRTDVRAGLIGEIGFSRKQDKSGVRAWYADEEKVLRAGCLASARTGAPISIHPPQNRDPAYPPSVRADAIVDICEAEGIPPERVIMCHMDQSMWIDSDLKPVIALAERGVFIEFDLFGHSRYMFEEHDAQPSDWDRIDRIIHLIEAGYGDKLLVSHDIFLKHWQAKYGGFGLTHLLQTIIPAMKDRGISDAMIEQIFVTNPQKALTFAE